MDSKATVKVLRTVPELEEIREVWESWPGNRDSDVYSYLAFLRANPGTSRPYVLEVRRAGKLDAILVGRIDQGRLVCRIGYFGVSPRARIMYFVNGALRGNSSRENCDLLIGEILKALSQGEADYAYLNFLRRESDLFALATTKPSLLCRDYVRITQPHFATALPATSDEFYRSLSPKVRKNQKWQAKKLVNHFSGGVRIRCFREVEEIDHMIKDVELVARTSYQRGLGAGFVDSPMMREGLRLKAERGWLRGYVLYLGERPAAFWLGDVNGTTFGSDYIGYDPEFASHSPGMYLVLQVIERFCGGDGAGVTMIDFGQGHAQYKEVLSSEQWTESLVYIFAPTLKGISLNIVRSLIVGLHQRIKSGLARVDLLRTIRKRWRARLVSKAATNI